MHSVPIIGSIIGYNDHNKLRTVIENMAIYSDGSRISPRGGREPSKGGGREHAILPSACRHHEEPTLRQFFTRKYLLELDYFSCVLHMDTH